MNPYKLLSKIAAVINIGTPEEQKIQCNKDAITQFLIERLRNKIAQRLYKEINNSNTFELKSFIEGCDNYVMINKHTNIKIWDNGFQFAFSELKTNAPKISELSKIHKDLEDDSSNSKNGRTCNYHY